MKTVVTRKMGICPKCGSRLTAVFTSRATYEFTEGGFMRSVITKQNSYAAVCSCGFSCKMKPTINGGLSPDGKVPGEPECLLEKPNTIGRIIK